jgi:hypothetical protein
MTSAERPEADVAEQAADLDDPGPATAAATDVEADPADVLDQLREAGLPDEDEAPR